MSSKKPFDFWIFLSVLILISFGLVMVFSASAPYAYSNTKNHDIYFFLKSQLKFVLIGFVAMFVIMNIDYRKYAKWSPLLLIFSIVLLILVAIPGVGIVHNGARRWLGVGGQEFQPSEIAKFAVILFFSHSLSKRKDQLQYFIKGLVPYLFIIGLFAGLMLLEPHLSGTMVIALVACIILFAAGARIKHFALMAAPAALALTAAIALSDYRRERFLSFLNPFNDTQGAGWQVVNSLYAIGSGGLFGKGLGKSLQKFLYIPEPQNDFIMSVLAEELGFLGILTVIILFLIFIWRGIKVSMNTPDLFGSLLAVGITSLVAVQATINLLVITSSMPVTGMPMPFFSAGGTSLFMLMCEMGILLNISRHANYERI